jgi:hypothetical protein
LPDNPIPIRRETRAERRLRQIAEFAGHILSFHNIDLAAKAVPITIRTARHWLSTDAFGKAYADLNKPTLEASARLARHATPVALKACTEIVADPQAADTARVAAARVIIDSNLSLNEEPDMVRALQERIRALEQKLQEGRR